MSAGGGRKWSLASMTARAGTDTLSCMSPLEIHAHLLDLAEERFAAEQAGLTADPAYMADLETEIYQYRVALVGAVITEIASLRGELSGRNMG